MMQEYLAENARLRQLCKRYAAGEISLAELRAERRLLIEALEAGQAEPAPALLPDEAPGVTPAYGVPRTDVTQLQAALGEPVPADEPASAGLDAQNQALLLVLGVGGLLALVMLAYVLLL